MYTQQELVVTKSELDQRIGLLHRHMMSQLYDKRTELEKDRLMRLHIAMSQQSGILGEMIGAL